LLIDLGDVEGTVKGVIDDLKHMNKQTAKSIVNRVSQLGRELAVQINGKLTLKLRDMTKKILPDIAMTMNSNFIITRGNGSSGLPAGFYFNVSTNIANDLIYSINGIFKLFSNVLSKLGIGPIKIPFIGLTMSLFINQNMLGFLIEFLGMSAKCFFNFSSQHLSCKFNGKIFTMILEGLKYVFKIAKKYFDKVGKVIHTVSKKTFEAATKAISNEIKKSVGFIKNKVGKLIKVGGKAIKKYYNKLKKNKITKAISKGVKNTVGTIKKKTGKAIENAKKKVKKIFHI
jgi:hypothetical protein